MDLDLGHVQVPIDLASTTTTKYDIALASATTLPTCCIDSVMSDDNATPAPEALFRANKRRKIYRKRNHDEDDNDIEKSLSAANTLDELIATASEAAQARTTVVKKSAAKKQGIGFSANGPRDATAESTNVETSIVPFQPDLHEDVSAIDRFIKPTGTAVVVEDKHLTAYVVSKLAKLRAGGTEFANPGDPQVVTRDGNESHESHHPELDSADMPASGTAVRNRVEPSQSRAKPTRRRRPPPQKDPLATAREALIDQILHESPGEVALYSKVPTASRPSGPPSSSNAAANAGEDDDGEDEDPDEAAAQAFKKAFLADLEDQQNRRRKPAPPATNTAAGKTAAAQILSGPKLGGSRAQRQRMHAALAEAEKGGSAVGSSKGGAGVGKK
ncbi:unnamed protein product [Zymoseptoria tritici ST99CH_1A5]|uniref:Uncharacterized protein n=1 Tax=Zymoseptoria tritici ST99CH_1A5 TaxID=1276529 RepID=A0A1Y6LL02_ZYMTR|nr:unnamed protein product [Zymoseptoria tritici ST99CH_1A5]